MVAETEKVKLSSSASRRRDSVDFPAPEGEERMIKSSRRLLADDDSFTFSVSATTRKPRPGEIDGVDYHFHSHEEFRRLVETDGMLEHAEVSGNFYGSPRAPVEAAIEAGRDVLFDVDWQGGQQLRNSALREAVASVFILPPSIAELERRLRARAQDPDAVIAHRMARARDEISHWDAYDYVLINDDLDRCEQEIRRILAAERLRRARRPGLVGFVQGLNREFQDRRS